MIQRAIPWKTSLARTLLGSLAIRNGVGANANIAITSLHDGKVVSRTVLAGILAIAEFEESLCLPLTGSAPFGVAREAHAEVFERSGDGNHLLGCDIRWGGAFEHLEVTSDLVKCDLLSERAVVPDIDVESTRVALN